MLKIAICDDVPAQLAEIRSAVEHSQHIKAAEPVSICCFDNPLLFLEHLDKRNMDLAKGDKVNTAVGPKHALPLREQINVKDLEPAKPGLKQTQPAQAAPQNQMEVKM